MAVGRAVARNQHKRQCLRVSSPTRIFVHIRLAVKWDSLLGDRASAGLDSSADGLAITAGDNSLKQIDLNIRMVSLR